MDPIFDRRSIRKFKKTAVADDIILSILNAGRAAPSAKNRQPWKYIIFSGAAKDELCSRMKAGIDREENISAFLPRSAKYIPDAKNTLRIMYEAPVLIIVLNTNGSLPFLPIDPDDRITEICDTLSIGASIQNILLSAYEKGLGTLWIANTCFAYKELTEYLNTEHQLVGAVALGYPDECPSPRPRKDLGEMVEFRR